VKGSAGGNEAVECLPLLCFEPFAFWAHGYFGGFLDKWDHVALREELPILPAHDVAVVPPAIHLASIIIRRALVLDTPGLGFVDSPA
jgi:hypothetical protein